MNLITFSTLACPDWPIELVIAKAKEFGYGGMEWRGGPHGHLQPNLPPTKISAIRQGCSEAGLISLAVTAYTGFVSSSAKERQANVDELQRYADLAAALGAKYVRTFLGELPEGTKIERSMYEKISDCLRQAADHAQSVGVIIAIEPHDNFVRSSSIVPILTRINHPALQVIWDIGNTFAADEAPAEGFALLKDHIAYVQVKDGRKSTDGWQLCSLGKGNVPLREAFELLLSNEYHGAVSVEWEYAWHPELDPPEIALPAALRTVQELLAAAQPESA
jgi:sugar phosphate isomerase/epimerase